MSNSTCQSCQFACAVLRILVSRCCRRLSVCRRDATQRPEYSVICLGLEGAGKSTILATLTNEKAPMSATTGFSLKAVGLPSAILNVQELGGGVRIRSYWNQYYNNKQAVVFVVDCSSDDDQLIIAQKELRAVLCNPILKGLPFLIIINKADLPDARTVDEILTHLSVEDMCTDQRWMSAYCSATDQEKLTEIFEEFVELLSSSKAYADDTLSL